MSNKTNQHVERLQRYLPFSPAHDQIYEEYQTTGDSLRLETNALQYLVRAVRDGARLVVLTGDAGHGKTHLCRRLLEEYLGVEEEVARNLINKRCDGSQLIEHPSDATARPIRIFKDFSELTIPLAVDRLEATQADSEGVSVVCANEGRLRAVLGSPEAGPVAELLRNELDRSFKDGCASQDGIVHVINLNYQSVATGGTDSLLIQTLEQWCSGNHWKICKECDCRSSCPINRNQQLVSAKNSPYSARRLKQLNVIFATMERLGVTITIRETLMAVSYILTGGLTCSDVHAKRGVGWQWEYAFYNLLFKRPPKVSRDDLSRIPVMLEIARLDPGLSASRSVDEQLTSQPDLFDESEIDVTFRFHGREIHAANGIDQIIGNPQNKKERRREAETVRAVIRSLRRRAFFDIDLGEREALDVLGFRCGTEFTELLSGDLSPSRMAELKGRVVNGLHMIQGLQFGEPKTHLYLVDPAFGRATAHAAIIARKIPAHHLKLLPESLAWISSPEGSSYSMTAAVNWLDRNISLRVDGEEDVQVDMDLPMFDCVLRAAGGYVARGFYAHDIRRVVNIMAKLAESGQHEQQEIELVLRGNVSSVSIDNGVIQVS